MLYQAYQLWTDMLTPARTMAAAALSTRDAFGALAEWDGPRRFFALADLVANTKVGHVRPDFAIHSVSRPATSRSTIISNT